MIDSNPGSAAVTIYGEAASVLSRSMITVIAKGFGRPSIFFNAVGTVLFGPLFGVKLLSPLSRPVKILTSQNTVPYMSLPGVRLKLIDFERPLLIDNVRCCVPLSSRNV